MKTAQIIAVLTEQERQRFARSLKKKQPRLELLWSGLLSGLPKAQLFQLVFERAYERRDDYLLRNELRLLGQRLRKFLADQYPAPPSLDRDLNLLRTYLARSAWALFEQDWRRTQKVAHQRQDWPALLQLARLWADYQQQKAEPRPEAFAQLLTLLDQAQTFNHALHEEQGAELDLLQALAKRYLRILGGQAHTHEVPALPVRPVAEFYQTLQQSHLAAQPAARLQLLLQAQQLQPQILTLRPQLAHSIIALNTNIGLEYFLARDFVLAQQYYDIALGLLHQFSDFPRAWDVRFNAYSNMLFAGHYTAAFRLYKHDFPPKDLPQRLHYRFPYLVALACLFNRQPASALQILNSLQLYRRPNVDYFYARLLYACAFTAENDPDNALRELRNIYQSQRRRLSPSASVNLTADLLRQYLNTQAQAIPRLQKEAAAKALVAQIQSYIQQSPQLDSLPLRWLLFFVSGQ